MVYDDTKVDAQIGVYRHRTVKKLVVKTVETQNCWKSSDKFVIVCYVCVFFLFFSPSPALSVGSLYSTENVHIVFVADKLKLS